MDVEDAFGASVELRGPDPAEWGYFVVRRRPDVDHERFLRIVSTHVGGDGNVVLDSPGGIVVVTAPFGVAQGLLRLAVVGHVGGVTLNHERLRRAFTAPP
jgi:hypothetical protein